ncbi:MAG: phycocyanin-associated rod-terminating linker protein CpcD [Phormidesmis priestleyi Ana]|uniref:Phycocyanin-associated rod-terminating linker protein CpcD n=1 Tax=Phormidesmis priestleyi Ana TaxID=1666911 RepID=A0A0P7ZY37_9CYAN|nr:MAG: phycocyanin-associated rod-terminating linker protein CpcD [Phormidesmis priestleyi Ana]
MLGQCSIGGASELNSRIFVYEVAGLSQNEVTTLSQAPIRASHNQFFQVPFARMNQEMQRILLMGGKIVNIQPLSVQNQNAQNQSEQNAEATDSED